jgi:hypothetical protein
MWGAGAALVLFLGLLSAVARSWSAAAVAMAVVIVGAYYSRIVGRWAGLVVLLIVTSVADHFTFSVGPLALRAEQVAAALALCVLLVAERRRLRSWLKPSLAEGFLIAWFAGGALSSLLASPDTRLSAKILTLIAISSLGLFLPRRLVKGPSGAADFEVVVRWLLVIFATESAYGVFAYLLHVAGPTISIAPNPASGHLSSYGTLWEQNVFGAFAAAGAVAWVYLGPGRFRRSWVGLAACVGGLFDSLTRAAWLFAAIVGAVGMLIPKMRSRIDLKLVAVGALCALVLTTATIVADRVAVYNVLELPGGGNTSPRLLAAVLNLVDIVGRLSQWAPVWSDIQGTLVIGRGIASFEALHVIQGVPQHIASLPLLVLNDTGVVGLAIFAGFVAAVIAGASSVRENPVVLALGQVALVVALTNLATETTELMIDWLLIGLLLAACDVASATRIQGPADPAWDRPT